MMDILRKLIFTSILVLISSASLGQPPHEVGITKWVDPLGRKPLSFKEYEKSHPRGQPMSIAAVRQKLPSPKSQIETGEVDLIVEASLYPHIQAPLDQYGTDLTLQGYTVVLDTMRGGTASQLRNYLQSRLPGIVGAVLIGDLPVAWFEMWGEEFPVDYYFMDLDGTWTDSNGDGLFDSHSGATAPEIWTGRLITSRLTWGDKVGLLRNYFEKNHAYRQGLLTVPQRALAFDDDDWWYAGSAGLELAYSDVTVVTDMYETSAVNYKNRLGEGYEFVHIMSHSCPWAHTFYPENHGGTVYNYEINLLDPHAFFYNLFACSNARFVETNNVGCWYIFVDTYGLWAVGSTKTGAMHFMTFEDFYGPVGSDSCFGDAFRSWYTLWAEVEPYWHYGMTMLGDPTLHIQSGSAQYAQPDPPPPRRETLADWTLHQVTTSTFSDGQPAIATDPTGWVWVAWASGRDVRSNIYECHYDGNNWSSPTAIAPHEYWDMNPELAVDGSGRPWVVWHSFRDETYNIYSSYHDGADWSAPIRVSSFDGYDVEPAVATDSLGRVWIAFKSWRDANANIYATYYSGSSWVAPMRVTTDSGDDCGPAITIDKNGTVWVFWYSNRNEDWELYASCYSGSTWSLPERITSDPSDDLTPSATVDTLGWVWVLWKSYRDGDANIYSKYFDGSNWSVPIQVTADADEDDSPSATCTRDDTLFCTWQTHRDGNWEIYESRYEGGSWASPAPVTGHSSPDISPLAASDDSGKIWVTWQTERNGNWDIYAAVRGQVGMEEMLVNDQLTMTNDQLFQNQPNPFRQGTAIRYQIPVPGQVSLGIYDIAGRLVKNLFDGEKEAGEYRAIWDGRTDEGEDVSTGVYYCRLRSASSMKSRKMIFIE